MIRFTCPTCGKPLGAPEQSAGKKARCAACKTIFQVPLQSQRSGPQGTGDLLPPPTLGITKKSLGGITGSVKAAAASPDGRHFACRVKRGNKELFVVDGVEGKEYDGADLPHFSPDSKHFAYEAKRGGKYFVVVDGVKGKEYFDVTMGPVFSPDSNRLAYVTQHLFDSFVVLDGVEGKEYSVGGVSRLQPRLEALRVCGKARL
jgi:hypothetical protein